MLYSYQELLFSVALAVFVAVSVVVAAVRWGHRCEPYARHMDYYYPAWKAVIACYLTNILMVPAVFLPQSTDALLQLRMMLILASPFFCAILMFIYFGKAQNLTWWRKPILALTIPFALMTLFALVLVFLPGTQLQGDFCRWFFAITGTLALVYIIVFFMALRMIGKAMKHFSEENYSNQEDFPNTYVPQVVWITVLHVLISWVVATIGTLPVLACGLIALSVVNTLFLISLLKPHRVMDVTKLDADTQPAGPEELDLSAQESEDVLLPPERQEEIAAAIRHYVEDEQAYLDSHLTLSTLSRTIGINRTYISMVMNEHFGGFFAYVNQCRLAHAEAFRVEHPKADIYEVALASGFNSRQSYYNARKRLN